MADARGEGPRRRSPKRKATAKGSAARKGASKGKARAKAKPRSAASGSSAPTRTREAPRARRGALTAGERERFLEHLRDVPNVAHAARQLGRNTGRFYELRKADDAFAEAWDEAVAAGVGELEREAIRRGRDGVRRPIYQGGQLVGHEITYSDQLLVRVLEAHDDRYRRRHEVTGAGGGPLVPPSPRDELVGALEELRDRLGGEGGTG